MEFKIVNIAIELKREENLILRSRRLSPKLRNILNLLSLVLFGCSNQNIFEPIDEEYIVQKEFLPYTDLNNRNILSEIGRKIVIDLAPDEELTSRKMTDEILRRYEQGDVLVAENSANDAGGFGDIDLATLVILPVLVSTLSEICKQLVIWTFEEIKADIKKSEDKKKKVSQMIDVIVDEKFEEINKKVKSKKGQKKGKEIRKAIKIRIKNEFEI